MSGRFGHFEDEVVTSSCVNAGSVRRVRVVQDLTYVDPSGARWTAPTGSTVLGDAIPAVVRDEIDERFIDDYPRAIVTYSVACDRNRPRLADSEAVHRMFYHAMRRCWVRHGYARLPRRETTRPELESARRNGEG